MDNRDDRRRARKEIREDRLAAEALRELRHALYMEFVSPIMAGLLWCLGLINRALSAILERRRRKEGR